MPSVHPNVLSWARETAGLSVEAAAKKLGFSGERGIARVRAIEEGHLEPTRSQLLRMAKAYRRSLLTLYLAEPPRKGDRGHDFRTLPQQHTTAEPLVDALVRDVRMRQSVMRSALEDDEDIGPLPFIGSMRMANGVAAVAASITKTLGFDLAVFRQQGSVDEAFAYIRGKAEAIGIFVLLMGNLGNHHTDVEVAAFRGLALADSLAPFVVINDHDAHSAWSFTLIHELAHLWLGETGISGPYGESQLERFCNDVASSMLLPGDELRALVAIGPNTTDDQAGALIGAFAGERFVSRSMVAYRLFRLGQIPEAVWSRLTTAFRQEWLAMRQTLRERAKTQKKSGPSYYIVRRHRLGQGLLRTVEQRIQEGVLTPTKAGLVLGVKPRNVAPLLSGLRKAS